MAEESYRMFNDPQPAVEEPVAVVGAVRVSRNVDELDAEMIDQNRPLIDAFGALDDRQKVLVLLRYIQYYGSLPAVPEETPQPVPPPPPAPPPYTPPPPR